MVRSRRGRASVAAALFSLLVLGAAGAGAQAPSASPDPCAGPGTPIAGARLEQPVLARVTRLTLRGPATIVALRPIDGTPRRYAPHLSVELGADACGTLRAANIAVGTDLVVAWLATDPAGPDLRGWQLVWRAVSGGAWELATIDPDVLATVPAQLHRARNVWALWVGLEEWRFPPDAADDDRYVPPPSLRPIRITVPVGVTGTISSCPSPVGCAGVLTLQAAGSEPTGVQLDAAGDGTLAAPGGALAAVPGPTTATLDVWSLATGAGTAPAVFEDLLATCHATLDVPLSSDRVALVVRATADGCSLEVAAPG